MRRVETHTDMRHVVDNINFFSKYFYSTGEGVETEGARLL